MKLIENFINMLSKSAYYISDRNGNSYQMCLLILDDNFRPEEKTTQAQAWISFSDLLSTFFVKESPFLLASAIGKPYIWM